MKKTFLVLLGMAAVSTTTLARQGEHDNGQREDDGRIIRCVDMVTNAEILQFNSAQGAGQVDASTYTLAVKTKGDNIAEVSLLDKRSGDSLKVKALEELLKVTLTVDEDANNPLIREAHPHHGAGEITFEHPTSKDKVSAKSYSRRGRSEMMVSFVTDENPNAPMNFTCRNN